jgi:hypothetical protein
VAVEVKQNLQRMQLEERGDDDGDGDGGANSVPEERWQYQTVLRFVGNLLQHFEPGRAVRLAHWPLPLTYVGGDGDCSNKNTKISQYPYQKKPNGERVLMGMVMVMVNMPRPSATTR